ncbi:MAG: glycosyltransferase family 4 protein [Nitrospinae bacterium]|nr:glycosyltransferase family 4 protein [Nitrospinota bacterium]
MKKILYIHHGIGIGGAPLSLLYLLQKLDREKYTPIVLCLYESEAADLYRREGIETVIAKGIYEFSHTYLSWINMQNFYIFIPQILFFIPSILKAFFIIKKLRPDIVHLNSSTLMPCAIGAKMAGCKVVWHIREPIHRGYFGLRKNFLRWGIHRFSDRVIAICKNDASYLFQSDKIRVIYNFVDFKRFNKDISGEIFRSEFHLKKDERAIGMLGGIAESKGTMEFVKAAGLVRKRIESVKFFVIGELPSEIKGFFRSFFVRITGMRHYFSEMKEFIVKEGLEKDIIFTGERSDIPHVIAGLDLIVFPSIVPHFARPVIEAGAMGKPVVASDIGGPRELVADGITGRLCQPGNVHILAEAITDILINVDISKKMGEAGFQQAKDKFDADKNAKETFLLYEGLV